MCVPTATSDSSDFRYVLDPRDIGSDDPWANVKKVEGSTPARGSTKEYIPAGRRLPGSPEMFGDEWWRDDDRVSQRPIEGAGHVGIADENIPVWIRGYSQGRYANRQQARASNVVRGGSTALTGESAGTALTKSLGGASSARSKDEARRRGGSALTRSAGGS